MAKRPAFQFYPADWRNDPALRLVSMGSRGLWVEMICLMHEADPYGHLVISGKPVTAEGLARLVAEPVKDVKKWLNELGEQGVYAVTSDGVIYSKRMVRDEKERGQWRDRQERRRDKERDVTQESRTDHGEITFDVTPMSHRSSSSSSSSSSKKEVPPLAPPGGSSEPSAKTAEAAEPKPPPQEPVVVFSLPCVGNGPKTYGVTESQIAKWQQAFPGIDILTELRKSKAWLEANPSRMKTHRGMPKFVVGWLSRTQDRPQISSRASPSLPRNTLRSRVDSAHLEEINGTKNPNPETLSDSDMQRLFGGVSAGDGPDPALSPMPSQAAGAA